MGARVKEGRKAPHLQPLRGRCAGLRCACRSATGRGGTASAALQQPRSLNVTSSRFPSGRDRAHSAVPPLPVAERLGLIALAINPNLEDGGGEALTGHRSPGRACRPPCPSRLGARCTSGAPFTRYGEIISLTAVRPGNRGFRGESSNRSRSCHARQERPSTRKGLPLPLRARVTGWPDVPSPPPGRSRTPRDPA